MATIMPEGDALRKAVKWISAQLQEDPQLPVMKLCNDASLKFDLSPKDSQFLINFYKENRDGNA